MSRDTTPEQFIEAAHSQGLDADLVRLRHPDDPQAVNVWKADSGPIPDATVWWPRPDHSEDQITWGPNFDHTAHRDIPAGTLVERVKETLA